MDIYGMWDRLLEQSALALRWLDKNSPTEAKAVLEKVVRMDGSYVPRDLGEERGERFDVVDGPPQHPEVISALARPLPVQQRDDDAAREITVTYPSGKHTFVRVGPDQWRLDLQAREHPDMPSVSGYDDGNVLRVLAAFLRGN